MVINTTRDRWSLNSRVVLTCSSQVKYSIYMRRGRCKIKNYNHGGHSGRRKVSPWVPSEPALTVSRKSRLAPVPNIFKTFVFTHSCRSSARPVLRHRSRSTTSTPPPRAGPDGWYVSSSCSALRCPTVCGAKTFLIVSAPPFPRYIPDDPLCVRLDFN